MKICTKCHQEKSLSEFSFHPKTKDKLSHICKGCKASSPWERSPVRRGPGYVYLVRADNGLCKIGITDNIHNRMRSLQAASPIFLVLLLATHMSNPAVIESQLHQMFQHQYSHGEWFRLSAQQIEQAQEILYAAQSKQLSPTR